MKDKLFLYVIISQIVIVIVGLLNLFKPEPNVASICQKQYDNSVVCYCSR